MLIVVQWVVIYVMFIETKGPFLEEVALLFDGMNANVGGTGRLVFDAVEHGEKEQVVTVEETTPGRKVAI